jgi:hypothetical protein
VDTAEMVWPSSCDGPQHAAMVPIAATLTICF